MVMNEDGSDPAPAQREGGAPTEWETGGRTKDSGAARRWDSSRKPMIFKTCSYLFLILGILPATMNVLKAIVS